MHSSMLIKVKVVAGQNIIVNKVWLRQLSCILFVVITLKMRICGRLYDIFGIILKIIWCCIPLSWKKYIMFTRHFTEYTWCWQIVQKNNIKKFKWNSVFQHYVIMFTFKNTCTSLGDNLSQYQGLSTLNNLWLC